MQIMNSNEPRPIKHQRTDRRPEEITKLMSDSAPRHLQPSPTPFLRANVKLISRFSAAKARVGRLPLAPLPG